jgi:hypothetical protein
MATLPDYPHHVRNKRKLTAIDGQRVAVTIEDEIIRPQGKPPHTKLIYLQKLRFESDRRLEYRFTYYMIGYKGKTKGRWVFGQYSLMIPVTDLKWLLKKAREQNWQGF